MNINIIKALNNKNGSIIMAVLWGFALAALFKVSCEGRDCIVIKAPDVKEVTGNTYQHNNECYTFKTETVECTGDEIGH